jgi:hypothetical protein
MFPLPLSTPWWRIRFHSPWSPLESGTDGGIPRVCAEFHAFKCFTVIFLCLLTVQCHFSIMVIRPMWILWFLLPNLCNYGSEYRGCCLFMCTRIFCVDLQFLFMFRWANICPRISSLAILYISLLWNNLAYLSNVSVLFLTAGNERQNSWYPVQDHAQGRPALPWG